MTTDLTDLPWERLDLLLEEFAEDAVDGQCLVDSLVLIFTDGTLQAILATPTFLVEDADRITSVLCEFLPRFHASHLAIVWPFVLTDEDDQDKMLAIGMKVHRYDRQADQPFVTDVRGLPLRGCEPTPTLRIDCPAPWTQRIRDALLAPAPPNFGLVNIMDLPRDFALYTPPATGQTMTLMQALN